jgi:LPS-assembly lipoprotein
MSWSEQARACLLIALVVATVAGCGFRLQGAAVLPAGIEDVYVSATDELTPFAVELRQALQRVGARESGSAAEADVVIRVLKDRAGRRVLSVSSRNTPEEYEIFYEVEYSIDRAGSEAVPRQALERTRNFSFDEAQLLAKDREESILRDAMARELAGLVVRRLESL